MKEQMIMLTNSPIVVPSVNVLYDVSLITLSEAVQHLLGAFTCAIGHQGTVDMLKTILPAALANAVYLNRIEIKEPSRQIVFKLKGRLPEGKILSKDEIIAIGYEFWLVQPIPRPPPPGATCRCGNNEWVGMFDGTMLCVNCSTRSPKINGANIVANEKHPVLQREHQERKMKHD